MENNQTNETIISASLQAIKNDFEERVKKVPELYQLFIDYKKKTVSHYYKLIGDNTKYKNSETPLQGDKETWTLSEMMLSKVKGRIKELSEITYLEITFDMKKLCIKCSKVYYLKTNGEKSFINY